MEGQHVVLTDPRNGERRTLADGQRLEFGPIVVEVRTAEVKDPKATPPELPRPHRNLYASNAPSHAAQSGTRDSYWAPKQESLRE